MTSKFDNPISTEEAYRLLCTQDADLGARNSISARGWIKHSSWMRSEQVTLADGSYVYRDQIEGKLWHSNMSAWDVLGMFAHDYMLPSEELFIQKYSTL